MKMKIILIIILQSFSTPSFGSECGIGYIDYSRDNLPRNTAASYCINGSRSVIACHQEYVGNVINVPAEIVSNMMGDRATLIAQSYIAEYLDRADIKIVTQLSNEYVRKYSGQGALDTATSTNSKVLRTTLKTRLLSGISVLSRERIGANINICIYSSALSQRNAQEIRIYDENARDRAQSIYSEERKEEAIQEGSTVYEKWHAPLP